MGLWGNLRTGLGNTIALAGRAAGSVGLKKDYGLSEMIGGYPMGTAEWGIPRAKAADTNQPTDWTMYDQPAGPVNPDPYGQFSNTAPSGTTSGTTTAPEAPFVRYLGGTQYTDPIAYTNAVTEASITEFNRQKKLLDDAYQSGLLEFAQYKDQLDQARENVKQQHTDAMSAISGRFNAISPDVYQSSQGAAENRATDITNQNYANIAGQEANLGQQKALYEQDYTNNLAANELARQNQVDQTVNSALTDLADTSYANRMGEINAPKLDTLTPMDSSILGVYDNLTQLAAGGKTAAIKSTIKNLNIDPTIKDWLYTRFTPTKA